MSSMRVPKVSKISFCCVAASLFAATATSLGRDIGKRKDVVQDGIVLDVHGKEEAKNLKHSVIDLNPPKSETHTVIDNLVVPVSALQQGTRMGKCEDVASEHTGFDVNDDNGFVKHASCDDLEPHCHDESIGEQVRVSCPVSCFICIPGTGGEDHWYGPCFDAVNTGIRFRDGPKAACADLINYCNHTAIGDQVKEACKLSCGLCELHVEGPYQDAYGNCEDLASHEQPEFTIGGALAGCADMAWGCQGHDDSYLIRHKCPLTCGVCANAPTTEMPEAQETIIPGDTGGCDRRRRWGFCSSRRRRNI